MPNRPILDPGQPRVHPDDYPKAGLGEFHPPTEPQVAQDPARDERIASDVRSRLEHHEMIDASRVNISVVNGEVTMIGTADNRFIRHRAEELASEVDGIQKIVNKISVQPPGEEPGPILSTHAPDAKGGSTQRS
jgi:hypothetical protein